MSYRKNPFSYANSITPIICLGLPCGGLSRTSVGDSSGCAQWEDVGLGPCCVRRAGRQQMWPGVVWFILQRCTISPELIVYQVCRSDMKIVRQLRAPGEAVDLQTDLDRLSAWSDAWKLKLNPAKGKVITFTLRTKPVTFDYIINGTALERVSMIYIGLPWCTNRALGTYLRSLQSSRVARGKRFRPAPLLLTAFTALLLSLTFAPSWSSEVSCWQVPPIPIFNA